MLLVNQYSFLLVSLLLTGIVSLLVSKFVETRYVVILVVLMVSLLGFFHSQFKTGDSHELTVNSFNEVLSSGKPLVIIVYSDMCIACLSAKPEIDNLELQLNKAINVFRVNVASELGKYLRSDYNSGMVPSFLVFDSNGKEIWRNNGSVPQLDIIMGLKF